MDKLDLLIEELKALSQNTGIVTERDVTNVLSKYNVPMILVDEIFEQINKAGIKIDEYNNMMSSEKVSDKNIESFYTVRKYAHNPRIKQYWEQQQSLLNESSEKIKNSFFNDLKKRRIQSSYMPLVLLSFFDRTITDYSLPFCVMIEYFKDFYAYRKANKMVVERKDSIFCKSDPTDNEIRRLILSNPLGRSCLVKYIRYKGENDRLIFNENLWNSFNKYEIKKIVVLAKEMLTTYYNNLK